MKRYAMMLAIGAALALSACETTSTSTSATTSSALLTTTKALTVAENAYQLAASAVLDAKSAGLITPALAPKIKAANDQVVALLDAAHSAQNVTDQAQDANAALTAIGTLSALIPAKPAS